MKNFLVFKHYTLTDIPYYSQLKHIESEINLYYRLEELAVKSAETYLADVDEIIVHRFNVSNDQKMFKHHMQELYKLHLSEPCNILYCDLDVLFVRPVEIFGKFNQFLLLDSGNCGIRYYPSTINKRVWKTMFKGLEKWKLKRMDYKWDYEQDLYIKMMYSQKQIDDNYEKFIGQIVDQASNPSPDMLKILHFHSSRGLKNTIELMEEFWEASKTNNIQKVYEKFLNQNRLT